MQKEPKGKYSGFESCVFVSFCTTLTALRKVFSAKSPIAIHGALICLKETSSQDKEAGIIYVLKHIFNARQIMIRYPWGDWTNTNYLNLYHLTGTSGVALALNPEKVGWTTDKR